MFVISYQFEGETIEHKQIFTLMQTTVELVTELLRGTYPSSRGKTVSYIRISPKL